MTGRQQTRDIDRDSDKDAGTEFTRQDRRTTQDGMRQNLVGQNKAGRQGKEKVAFGAAIFMNLMKIGHCILLAFLLLYFFELFF